MRARRPRLGWTSRLRNTLLALAVGCSDDVAPAVGDASTALPDANPPSCPNDLPAACPAPSPHYADAAAVINLRCAPCHAPGGQAADRPLTTYAQVYPRRVAVLTQVYGCRMPPANAPALSPAERALLLDWLVCLAPR